RHRVTAWTAPARGSRKSGLHESIYLLRGVIPVPDSSIHTLFTSRALNTMSL
ncbi:hypothetical protein BE221DRAFT_53417, partial [Ostreococcus tauri]